jgi:hypothetical protein
MVPAGPRRAGPFPEQQPRNNFKLNKQYATSNNATQPMATTHDNTRQFGTRVEGHYTAAERSSLPNR